MDRGLGKKKKLEEANMPTTNHLLVIGINDYGEGIPKLNNAVKDAKAFENLLKKKYSFNPDHIISLYDKKATKDNILTAFDTIIKKLTKDDNLVFYFSGHGEMVETSNRGYWIPVEARANSRGSYMNTIEIIDFVGACKARHVLGIVDACYSGTLLRNMSNPLLSMYFTKPSRSIMTSGLKEPVPDGLPNHHSPFAEALLNALEYNRKPYLSAAALWQEMQAGLAANSFATAQFDTMKNVGHQGGDFFFLSTEFDDIPNEEAAFALSSASITREINTPTASPTQIKNNHFSKEEVKGLERQLELAIRVLNKIREAFALETDPARVVRYEVQIEEKEKNIQQLRQQLQNASNTNDFKVKVEVEKETEAEDEDISGLSLSEWKTALKRIAVTNLKNALTKTEDRVDTSSDAFNSLLLLQSRYHSAKKNEDSGLVTDQQSNISFNRIKAAFSGFIDDLEEYDVK